MYDLKAALLEKNEDAVENSLSGLSNIGKSVTARDYVERLLVCQGPKKVSKLAQIHPPINEATLHRVITRGNWNMKVREELLIRQACEWRSSLALVVEPVLIWHRANKMKGTVKIQPLWWDRPFQAQVVLVATVMGPFWATPVLWRLVRFDNDNPTLEVVRKRCAEEIVNLVGEFRSNLHFEFNCRRIIIQGSDLVDFYVVPKLSDGKCGAMMMLPAALSIQAIGADIIGWLQRGVSKDPTTPPDEFTLKHYFAKFAGSRVGDFTHGPIKAVRRDGAQHPDRFDALCPVELVSGRLWIHLNLTQKVLACLQPTADHYSLIPEGLKLSPADITVMHHYALRHRGMLVYMVNRLGLADYQGIAELDLQRHLHLVGCAWKCAEQRNKYKFRIPRKAQNHIRMDWETKLESPIVAPFTARLSTGELKRMHKALVPRSQEKKSFSQLMFTRPDLLPPPWATVEVANTGELLELMLCHPK